MNLIIGEFFICIRMNCWLFVGQFEIKGFSFRNFYCGGVFSVCEFVLQLCFVVIRKKFVVYVDLSF